MRADDAVDRDGLAARPVRRGAVLARADGRRTARAGPRAPLAAASAPARPRRIQAVHARPRRRPTRSRPEAAERGASEAWRSGGTSSSEGCAPDRAVALRTMMPSPSMGRHGPPGLPCDYSRSRALDGDSHLRPPVQAVRRGSRCRQRPQPRDRRWRVHLPGRSLRLRQDHRAAMRRRPGGDHRRAPPHRRPGRQRTWRRKTATSRWSSRATRSTRT